MGDTRDRPAEPDIKSALAAARDALVIVAIYLYFAGFVYRSAYLERIGAPANAAQDQPYQLIVYAYPALGRNFWWLFFAVIAVALVNFASLHAAEHGVSVRLLRGRVTWTPNAYRYWRTVVIALLAVGAVPKVYGAAHAAASDALVNYRIDIAGEASQPPDASSVVLTPQGVDALKADPLFDKYNASRQLAIMEETKDTYYLLAQSVRHACTPNDSACADDPTGRLDDWKAPDGHVYVVPKRYVLVIRTDLQHFYTPRGAFPGTATTRPVAPSSTPTR